MEIREVLADREAYMELLLLADEEERMLRRYLDCGHMFVLMEAGAVRAECLVTDAGGGVLEIQNLATQPAWQRRGYARQLLTFLAETYQGQFHTLRAGTGDSPATVPFYEKCGFTVKRREKNYFIKHYEHPIYECGRQLLDRVIVEKKI